jgi:hypothetical protein
MYTLPDWTLPPGQQWERLVMIKDRRTRRPQKLTEARAIMRLVSNPTVTYDIPITISFEGGASFCIPYQDTLELDAGTWEWDLVVDYRGYNEPVAQGKIEVLALNNITPLEGGYDMLILHDEGTDTRQRYTWNDSSGNLLVVQNARLQAVDAMAATVLDLKFYAQGSAPDEAAIALLPDIERGYLSPQDGISLEMHISEQNGIAPGDYTFDLKVQEAATGDWSVLSYGTIRVLDRVTDQTA